MKILYLLDFNINTLGGSQKSTKTIVDEMTKLDYKVGLFMPCGDKFEKDNVSVFTYDIKGNNKIFRFVHKLLYLRKCIKIFNPDIVHPQNPEIAALLLLGLKFGLIDRKRKYIFTDRHYYTEYSEKYRKIWHKYSYLFDYVVTTTENNKNEWIKNVGPANIACISNVLDDNWFEYSQKTENTIKNKYNCSKTVNIGFAGRFVKYKRWDTAFEICKLLNDNNHKFFFAMASDNNSQMDDYIDKLKSELGNNVVIFKDADYALMNEFYYAIDSFVLTSDSESFGRTLLEAMTKNNVVFGTNSGGVPNILDKKYLFEVGNSKTIADKIDKYFKDKDVKKVKQYFMDYVKNKYSTRSLSNKLDSLYRSMLSG